MDGSADPTRRLLGDAVTDELLGGGPGRNTGTTKYLANKYGVKNRRIMYISYYIPFLNWIGQYKWIYLRGDLIAALTVASIYIPMALSYASNLGHIPPINGLYSFVFNPIIYAMLGTCPLMIVGPEAAGSLLTGQVVRDNIKNGKTGDENAIEQAQIAGIVTTMAGAVILSAGLFRLGFLDNVLSRPFLRGFISAIGIVIFVDQLIPEMGLSHLATQVGGVEHGSCIDKVVFLVRNMDKAHKLTTAVSFGAFAIIMAHREIKKRLQPRYPNVAYIPDRFVIVVFSAILAWQLRWDEQGLEVLGNIKTHGAPFQVQFPTDIPHLKYASDAFSTSFIIALLGFFESSVAAKSLGIADSRGQNGLQNVNISANRELVALGVANVVGGLFMSLPAFGGYGRSKVNASTGGKTPMSSVFLSLITLICILFLLPSFYYLPKGVLSAMISVVAYSLLEEAPHDLRFFFRIRGWSELTLMLLIFLATVFWNLKIGIAVGIGVSLLRVLRHSTRPRIQILGRVPGTTDKFENAEAEPGRLENIEGALIVKIPEPLTFANTGDLKGRLKRLEAHGTVTAHPALPRIRKEEHNRNIIFDVHGVTSLDGAGAQVLSEIIDGYVTRGVRVFFCRVPSERSGVWRLFVASGIVDKCGGRKHFVSSVEEALRMSEIEDGLEEMAPPGGRYGVGEGRGGVDDGEDGVIGGR
ncbi:sulfate transporter [Eremomyces bilateralis CBS 781.70]|uniref:Sulfate transporter n=1 Tax=Eremomyces bilateralis CBS 781.70 TaxID=1392243 RepID=A0A6G1G100_9PEZI|nr:sulfate transporter [Eremomyces bilateralis CBS 781.70]KAF1811662.1 sulfate transporter [Eremomyces bilateralis CBS 781.70]